MVVVINLFEMTRINIKFDCAQVQVSFVIDVEFDVLFWVEESAPACELDRTFNLKYLYSD